MRGNSSTKVREYVFYCLGFLLIAGFVYLYWTRFTLKPGMPPAINALIVERGRSWAIAVNAAVFILFLVFLPYRKRIAWRSKGAFSAFILALMAEMFGIPLLFYILAPFIRLSGEIQVRSLPRFLFDSNFVPLGWPGMILGAWMTLVGMLLVIFGWKQIHRAGGLVTGGLYAYIRHPQYTGLFLIIIGWILHWATLLTLVMCPILLLTYYFLARREESDMLQEFGEQYAAYRRHTGMFLPHLRKIGARQAA